MRRRAGRGAEKATEDTHTRVILITLYVKEGGVDLRSRTDMSRPKSGQKQKNITEGLNHVIHAMPDPTHDDHMLFPSIVLAVPKFGCHHTKKAKKQEY